MRGLPRDVQVLGAAAVAAIALWSFALVTATGRAQAPAPSGPGVDSTGGLEAPEEPVGPATGGAAAPPAVEPGGPPVATQPSPPPAGGAAPAAPEPDAGGTDLRPGPPAGPETPTPEDQEGSIPTLQDPRQAAPEPSPIAPLYGPEEMSSIAPPGRAPPPVADAVPSSYGVAAVLTLGAKAQATDPATPPVTETVDVLPPLPPEPPPPPRPPGVGIAPIAAGPPTGLAATGFEPLILAVLGSGVLLFGLGLRTRVAG
jgi:hypothetical protein